MVYLSNDSLKIFNGTSLICSGEIIKEKKTFSSYFKSIKTGSAIKTQLQENFKIPTADSVLSISNIYGDLAKVGCLFPFNEMFIAGNQLFIFEHDFHPFLAFNNEVKDCQDQFKFSLNTIPYQKKIDYRNVHYNHLSVKDISGLAEFSCGDDVVRYISIEKSKKLHFILVPVDCGDTPYRYYLLSIFNHQIASSLYVEGEMNEPENYDQPESTSFSINKSSILTVKTRNKGFKGKDMVQQYYITDRGRIVKANTN